MKRLLIITNNMNAGGAETFVMKLYRVLDKSKYQFDFIVNNKNKNFYEDEILNNGGKIYYVPPKSLNFIKYVYGIYNIVKQNKYKYIMRMSSHSLGTLDLLIGRLADASQLVLRSTNTDTEGGVISKTLGHFFSWMPKIIPTVKLAPSTEAAKYVFGNRVIDDIDVHILKNAIPIDKFKFDMSKREEIRNEFNLTDEMLIGHVGRFNKQKNHKFLLRIFADILKIKPNARLLLVGDGQLLKETKNEVLLSEFKNSVIFAGVRSDIPELMMAMDVMVFPSLFEGMPNAIIEAQATGMPCLLSSNITEEAKITDIVSYMSINNNTPTEWANKAIEMGKTIISREDASEQIEKSGYDIKNVVKVFEKIVFE